MIKLPSPVKHQDFTKLPYQEFANTLPPQNVELHDLGVSSDGVNHVYGLSVGKLDGTKPVIYIQGGIHGLHEWRCAYYCTQFIEMIGNPEQHAQKQLIIDLRNKFDFYVIPYLNPYGYENNIYQNANGVNLNRNFPTYWDDVPESPPFSLESKGTAPFSEPETSAVRDIVEQYKPSLVIDCHSHGGYYGSIFKTENDAIKYNLLVREISKSTELNTNKDCDYQRYLESDNRSRVGSWISTQTDKKRGKQMVACTFEVGDQETEKEQARIGITGLLLACLHFSNWYETSRQTTK